MITVVRRVALGLVPVLVVLAVGEGLLRLRDAAPPTAVTVESWRPYEPHPVLGWAPVAGGVHVLRAGPREVREVSSSLRLLGPEVTPSKPTGTLRVLLLGDSITEGLEVVSEERFATRLQADLAARSGRRTEVLNAGRSGYQTDQELLYYEQEARSLAPDVVVLVMYVGNDIIGNVLTGNDTGYGIVPKPRAVVSDGEISFAVPGASAMADRRAAWTPLDAAGHWVASNVAVYRAARSAWLRLTRPPVVPVEWSIFRREQAPETEDAWRLTELLLARLRRSVEDAGARLVIAVVPDQIQVAPARWQAFLETYRLAASEWDPDLPSRRIASTCSSQGLICVDLLPVLRAAADDPYLPRGGHLDASGHALVASAILPLVTGAAEVR